MQSQKNKFKLQLSHSSVIWPPYVSCNKRGHNIYQWGGTHTKLAALEWIVVAGGNEKCLYKLSLPSDFKEPVVSPFLESYTRS